MAKKITKPTPPKAQPKAKKETLFERWENRLSKNENLALGITLGISLLFSILLFDVKISNLNDDSGYIEGGYSFAQDIRTEYTANAPLYPLLLSLPIKLFGINIILLKSISVLFTLLHLWILYLAFRKRVPYLVIFPVILLLAVNSYIQFFASLTFTEAVYMFLQALFIYYFFNAIDKTKDDNTFKTNWKYWLLLGLATFLLGFCKNIAIGAVAAVILMLVIQRRWIHILYAAGGILAVRIPTDLIKKSLWGHDQFSYQTGMLMQIDPYNKSKGMETAGGFIQRFFDNTSLYISKRLYQILGFIDIDSTQTKAGLIFITAVFFIIALVAAFRSKNTYMIFNIVFALVMMGLTFTVLQKHWDQARYILIYVPFILLTFFYAVYTIVQKQASAVQLIYIVFISVFIGSSFIASSVKASKYFTTLKKNLGGDIYYGYTPDWVNYLKLSAYAADSLPPTTKVACRKAPMSFIYGHGKSFFPVYNVFSTDPDTVLAVLKKDHVTHVIIGSIRRNPKTADGYTINTMERLLQPVRAKYPGSLVQIKQMGETEPAYLFELKYPY